MGSSQDTGFAQQPFRWTSETGMVGLGRLPGAAFSLAMGISANGAVIVGHNTFPGPIIPIHWEAFRWTQESGMTSLGDFPGGRTVSVAHAASADGWVIVGSAEPEDVSTIGTAFYWTAQTGLVSLQQSLVAAGIDLDGWLLSEATGASDDGLTIVGYGTHNGVQQAFVATIPEPSSIVLAAFAVAGIVCFVRSKRKWGSTA
ncbi:MAG TPA: hypothetical protein VJ809_17025 [Pirellulales bacterium]|nr:hypothetical protein [Pirellulales bacterium]